LDEFLKDALTRDPRLGETLFWWKDNQSEVSTFWHAYQSRWIPLRDFEDAQVKQFAETLFEASRHWRLEIHFNKGQAGASAEAIARSRHVGQSRRL
jgi:hypothetical protein